MASLSVCFSAYYWQWPCQEISTCIILLMQLDSLKLMGLVKKVKLLLLKCLLLEVPWLETTSGKSGRNSNWTLIFIISYIKRNSVIPLWPTPDGWWAQGGFTLEVNKYFLTLFFLKKMGACQTEAGLSKLDEVISQV